MKLEGLDLNEQLISLLTIIYLELNFQNRGCYTNINRILNTLC